MAGSRIVSKTFILAFLGLFSTVYVFNAYVVIMAEYSLSLGAPEAFSGIAAGIFIVGAMAARLVAGDLIDRLGWRVFCLGFLFLHVLACAGYFVCTDLVSLTILRFFHGFTFGTTNSAFLSIGFSSVPVERYGEGTGYFMLSAPLGIAIGPYTAGLLYDTWGPTAVMIASLCFAILALALVFFLDFSTLGDPRKGEPKPEKKSTAKGISRFLEVDAVPLSACMLVIGVAFSSIQCFYRLYAVEVHLETVFGFFFLIDAIALIISRLITGKIMDRYGDNPVLYSTMIFQGIGLIAVALWPNVFTVILCAACCAFGFGTMNSSMASVITRNAPNDRMSYAISTYYVFVDGSTGIGTWLMGAVIAGIGFKWTLICSGIIALLCIPYYYMIWGRYHYGITDTNAFELARERRANRR